MHKYQEMVLLMAAMSPTMAAVQPAPAAQDEACPMQFKIQCPAFEEKSSQQVLGVEAKFQKYTLSDVSSKDTDILWFWEVRLFPLNDAMTQLLNRQIKKSTPLFSR